MPRPRLRRRVRSRPEVVYFKPAGIPQRILEQIELTVSEFEALRLKDYEALSQEESAREMQVSQPTFHRIILSARKKISQAIVKGMAIKITGGNYDIENYKATANNFNIQNRPLRLRRRGRGIN